MFWVLNIVLIYPVVIMIKYISGLVKMMKLLSSQTVPADGINVYKYSNPLEDADLEHAAKQIVGGAYSYSGQRCTAIKRVIVMESVADKLAALIKAEVEKLTVGDPFDNADITPIIDHASADFIWGLIEDAQKKGASALTEIKREANLIWPALFDHVTLDMKVAWKVVGSTSKLLKAAVSRPEKKFIVATDSSKIGRASCRERV